jgi:hypothetical protein
MAFMARQFRPQTRLSGHHDLRVFGRLAAAGRGGAAQSWLYRGAIGAQGLAGKLR